MKAHLILLSSLLLTAMSGFAMDSRFQSLTPAELFGYGDFNGDGRMQGIVIDRASGAVRLLAIDINGNPQWAAAIASGLQSVDTFSVGPILHPGRDQLALGGVMANRTHLLNLNAGQPLIEAIFTNGVGHRDLAAVDLGLSGNDPSRMDLLIATGWFDQPASVALFQSTASGVGSAAMESPATVLQRAHARVRMLENGKDYVLYLSRSTPDGDEVATLVDPASPGSPPVDSVAGIAMGSQFIHGPLLNGAANQFIFYVQGSSTIQISTTQPVSFLQEVVNHTLAFPVGSLHLMRDSVSWGFVAIAEDGTEAAFYRLNGSAQPVLSEIMSAAAGSRFSGVLALETGRLSLLLSDRDDGLSTDAVHFSHIDGQWQETDAGHLPAIGPLLALPNVLLFAGEPFVNDSATLTAAVRVGDWTRGGEIAPGGNVSVITETLSPAGLTGGTLTSAGNAPAATTFLWTNQLAPSVSLAATQPLLGPQASLPEISPASGTYDRYFRIHIVTTDPAATIHYRFGNSGPWLAATGSVVLDPPGATLLPVDLYAFAERDGVRSPIQHANYLFFSPDGPLDSDNDGVPDYVELALGLDPQGGPDSDGDGFSDLREILAGTDAGDDSDFPSTWARMAGQSSFDIAVQPLSFDSFSTLVPDRPSYAASANPADPAGTRFSAYDMDGRLLASATTSNNPSDGLPGVSALLQGLPAEPLDGFVVLISDPNFPIQPDATISDPLGERTGDRGIELIGLIPVPQIELPAVNYIPAPGTAPATAASAWIAAAQAHFAGLEAFRIAQPLTYLDTLKLLLAERMIALLLAQRDAHFDADTFSLTAPRDPASALAQPVGSAAILALQNPGPGGMPAYRLHDIFQLVSATIDSPPVAAVQNLRTLARAIYVTAGTLGSESEGLYPSAVNALRAFLRGQNLPGFPDTSYAAAVSLSSSQINAAKAVPANLLSQLTPREQKLFVATVTESTFEGPVPQLQITGSGEYLQLLDASGDPFPFPVGLPLLPGTELSVLAFNDRSEIPFAPDQSVEVIQVTLSQLPRAAPVDLDQNGLDDNWERLFFGRTGINPFADADGDGISNLEEWLRGTHPRRADSSPSTTAIPLQLPPVDVTRLPNGDFALSVRFPTEFSGKVGFRLQIAEDLSGNFFETSALAQPHADGTYQLIVSTPPNLNAQFYRFRLFLR